MINQIFFRLMNHQKHRGYVDMCAGELYGRLIGGDNSVFTLPADCGSRVLDGAGYGRRY